MTNLPLLHPLARAVASLLAVTLLAVTASAQTVPALVNYQGRLANPDGSPLPTADYTLTFNVYDAATNGALVWGPQVFDGVPGVGRGPRIPVVQGYFNVMLGPVDTTGRALSDAFNGAARYVEVTVSNRPPIAPRQQILTTPFAFQAANSAKLAGYDWSALFGTNNPVAGTMPFGKLSSRQTGTNVPAGGIAVSASCGVWNSPSPNASVAISNFSLTITTRGNPVIVYFVSDGTPAVSGGSSFYNVRAGGGATVGLELLRNASGVGFQQHSIGSPNTTALSLPPGSFLFMDSPPSGTHTYVVNLDGTDGGNTEMKATNIRMIVQEL